MNEGLKSILDCLRALVEMEKTHFDYCVKMGFTKHEALELTKNWVAVAMSQGKSDLGSDG